MGWSMQQSKKDMMMYMSIVEYHCKGQPFTTAMVKWIAANKAQFSPLTLQLFRNHYEKHLNRDAA